MQVGRLFVVVLAICIVILLAFALYRLGPAARWFPGCLLYKLTGLHCPGCGMTRAVHATLHGRLGEAFRFNPVGMVLLPAALIGLGLELLGWVRGKPLPLQFRAGGRWAWWLAGSLLVFWILRNIPAWPFTLLAPP